MKNGKKGMCFCTMWIEIEDKKEIKKIFQKNIKTDKDLALLGDIFNRINDKGDLKL